jgi:hypothetical protein
VTRAAAYVIRYGLDLYSNFTYFLDDPVNGDQFKQADRRMVYGGRVVHRPPRSDRGRPQQFPDRGAGRRIHVGEDAQRPDRASRTGRPLDVPRVVPRPVRAPHPQVPRLDDEVRVTGLTRRWEVG